MSVLLDVVAPVFGIAALGFAAARARILDASGVKGLVLFVFNFAIPVLLFRSLAALELPEDVAWGFLVAFYTGSVTTYGLGLLAARRLFHRPLDHAAIFGMSAAFSNTVLMGIPIVLTAFGPEATLPLFLIIAFHSATFMPLTVGIIQASRGTGVSLAEEAREVALAIVGNPIVVGLALGLVVNLTGVAIPGPLDRVAEMLGRAAVPSALFALGASVAGYPLRGENRPALVLTALKLVAHPLIVWTVAGPVLGIQGIWLHVAVVMAAMPSGVNVYLFGARYDAAPGVAARTVLLTSVLSVATISTLLVLFGGSP
ncbi:MAG TPA: AEC family transporter [Longimicrobiales bacterium]|nr:AEC family transporter [Longimicrobiales bacterium]